MHQENFWYKHLLIGPKYASALPDPAMPNLETENLGEVTALGNQKWTGKWLSGEGSKTTD